MGKRQSQRKSQPPQYTLPSQEVNNDKVSGHKTQSETSYFPNPLLYMFFLMTAHFSDQRVKLLTVEFSDL